MRLGEDARDDRRKLAKVGVAGSNPVVRSNKALGKATLPRASDIRTSQNHGPLTRRPRMRT